MHEARCWGLLREMVLDRDRQTHLNLRKWLLSTAHSHTFETWPCGNRVSDCPRATQNQK